MFRRTYLPVQGNPRRVVHMAATPRPADLLAAHLIRLFHDPVVPGIPPGIADVEGLVTIHEEVGKLRDILDAFSRGDLSPEIRMRGVVAGRLKTLRAGLLHLCWQIQQVADGDFSHRVDFLGEFASSFNSMVAQLDAALTTLRRKEEELTNLTEALQNEVAQKAEALEALSKSESRFRYMAEHDPLTGVCNRRSFYDLATMDLDQARKSGVSCTLIMFDIDHFKLFNDAFGHLDGDAALRHVTQTVKAELRQEDILGRYGGEEFVVLLPGPGKRAGVRVAERLRNAVASTPVETGSGMSATITISIGLVCVPARHKGERTVSFLEKILGFADSALYEAKNSGRNRVVSSTYPNIRSLPSGSALK